MTYHTRGEHTNHYTTDAVPRTFMSLLFGRISLNRSHIFFAITRVHLNANITVSLCFDLTGSRSHDLLYSSRARQFYKVSQPKRFTHTYSTQKGRIKNHVTLTLNMKMNTKLNTTYNNRQRM
jgi:hypothetical protein